MVYSFKNEYGVEDLSTQSLFDLSNKFEVLILTKNDLLLRKKYVNNFWSGGINVDTVDFNKNGKI